VVALAVAGEHLQRPRPDAGNGAQAPPAGQRVAGEQVDAAGGHLGRDAPQGQRAVRREVHRGELGGRRARQRRGSRRVAQSGARAARSPRGDHAPLDRDRAVELDQLLGHGRGERLPRQRRAPRAQLRRGPHRAPDHGVVAKRVVERAQVLVDARGEAQATDAPHRVGLRARPRAEDDAVGCSLDDGDVHGRAVAVQQPLERRALAPQQPVGRAVPQAEGPRGPDFDAELGHACSTTGRGGGTRRWMPRSPCDGDVAPPLTAGIEGWVRVPRRPFEHRTSIFPAYGGD